MRGDKPVRTNLLAMILFSFGALCVVSNDTYAQNTSSANPKDIQQAQKFLSDMPPACKNSSSSVSYDGTVVIHVVCIGPSPERSIDGEVQIKDGIVKKVR